MRLYAFILILSGVAVGSVGTLLLLPDVHPVSGPVASIGGSPGSDARETITRLRENLNERENALAREMARAANLEQRVRQLEEELDALPDELLFLGTSPDSEEEDRRDQAARRQERMMNRFQRQVNSRVEAISRVAGLSPDQMAAVQALLQDHQIRQFEAARATRRDGAPSAPAGPSLDERLQEVLTTEQFVSYQEFRNAEQHASRETAAIAQTNAVAPQLGLTEEQKDAVYSLYYQNLEIRMNEAAPPGEDYDAFLSEQMQSVLSPEQFAEWQSIQERTRGGGFFRRFP